MLANSGQLNVEDEACTKESTSHFVNSENVQKANCYPDGGHPRLTFRRPQSLPFKFKGSFLGEINDYKNDPLRLSVISQAFNGNSTFGLIMNDRPDNVPPKSVKELDHHIKLTNRFFDSVRKEQFDIINRRIVEETKKIQKEQQIEASTQIWKTQILPFWKEKREDSETYHLWWTGVPPSIRSQVWKMAVANELKITKVMASIYLSEAEGHFRAYEKQNESQQGQNIQQAILSERLCDLIKIINLDTCRTYPQLNIYKEDGPCYQDLRKLLLAYGCFRKDIGYVQGMSFIVAILLVNLSLTDAFVVFCNIMNSTVRLAMFMLDECIISIVVGEFDSLMANRLPKLHQHFHKIDLKAEVFLIEWLLTCFLKLFPLDIASRIIDLYFRDGEIFLFRTALGYLRTLEQQLVELDAFSAAILITSKKTEMDNDMLFDCISLIKPPRKWYHKLRKRLGKKLDL